MAKVEIEHLSLEEIVQIANRIGLDYVQAKKKSDKLELLKPTMRSKAIEKYDNGSLSETKIKRLAEIDADYIQFLHDLNEAKSATDQLRIRYESYKNLFEAKRSSLSFLKAEMRMT